MGSELDSAVPAGTCVVDDAIHTHAANTEFRLAPVTEEGLAVCGKLHGESAVSVVNIPADLIKESIHALKTPLLRPILINNSIVQGISPEVFKVASVTAIYKGGEKGKCLNYRPLFLLRAVGKVLEKCVKNNWPVKFLTSCRQYGFRNDLSFDYVFFDLTNNINSKLEY